MDFDHAIALFLALVLIGAAVALAYGSPALLGGRSDDVADASLVAFETTPPHCADPGSSNSSTVTRDIPRGEALVVNETIPVSSNDTAINASFEQFGPQRYILRVTSQATNETDERTATGPNASNSGSAVNETRSSPASAGQDCQIEVRYNATIHVVQPSDYTVLVTYDGELIGGYWREGDGTGSFDTAPRRPATPVRGNRTATSAAAVD